MRGLHTERTVCRGRRVGMVKGTGTHVNMLNTNVRPASGNAKLNALVGEISTLCRPDRIHWCDGSKEESAALCDLMVKSGTLIRLNEQKRPGSFLARSHPGDVARVEHRTFICSANKDDTGPTNN